MNTKTTLVLNKICPFAERAWITLQQKKIPHELREVSLTNKEPFFTETYHKAYGHDPKSDGKVPILIDDDKILTESDLISWYLAEKYNTGTELIPENAFDKLRMRQFAQTHGKIIGLFYGFIGYKKKSKEDQDKHLATIEKALEHLESSLTLPFALGDSFTLADVFIYPWFARWSAIEASTGVKIDEKFIKIHNWLNNIKNRDSVKVTRQSDEFYITGYSQYFN